MFDPNETPALTADEATHERYLALKGFAQLWAYEHGWMIYEGISDDIQEWAVEEHTATLTEDDLDTILTYLEDAELVFKQDGNV
jgi:hypothetical protein